MKKKATAIVIVLVVVAAGVFFLTPAPLIKDAKTLEIHYIGRVQDDVTTLDVTERFDLTKLRQALVKYQRSRIPRSFAPYENKLVAYEISTIDKGSWHILLGDINFAYESGERGGFEIKNAGALLEEVRALDKGKGA